MTARIIQISLSFLIVALQIVNLVTHTRAYKYWKRAYEDVVSRKSRKGVSQDAEDEDAG